MLMIVAVCKRADIPYKSSHLVGQHSFATNAISLGVDIKTAMESGGWKTSSVFIDTYVHMDQAGFQVAEKFNNIKLTI